MTIGNFVAYVKQAWKNKPDTSTPLSAPRLLHMEDGIKMTSDAIEKIAAAVVSQIVNDPNKIASMAALYAVNQKIGDVANLPNGAADVVAAITQQYSNLQTTNNNLQSVNDKFYYIKPDGNTISEIISNANARVIYRWADYNSAAYSPTGSNSYWIYEMYTSVTGTINYTYVKAINNQTGSLYLYSGNSSKWYKMQLSEVS